MHVMAQAIVMKNKLDNISFVAGALAL